MTQRNRSENQDKSQDNSSSFDRHVNKPGDDYRNNNPQNRGYETTDSTRTMLSSADRDNDLYERQSA